jgi:peptidoglycan biosynthesis protein MviN/MurJ (putative lipid II flippase)
LVGEVIFTALILEVVPVVVPIIGTGWAVTVTNKLVIILNPITKAAVIEAINAIVLNRTIRFFDNAVEYLLLSFIVI